MVARHGEPGPDELELREVARLERVLEPPTKSRGRPTPRATAPMRRRRVMLGETRHPAADRDSQRHERPAYAVGVDVLLSKWDRFAIRVAHLMHDRDVACVPQSPWMRRAPGEGRSAVVAGPPWSSRARRTDLGSGGRVYGPASRGMTLLSCRIRRPCSGRDLVAAARQVRAGAPARARRGMPAPESGSRGCRAG